MNRAAFSLKVFGFYMNLPGFSHHPGAVDAAGGFWIWYELNKSDE
jgi:hypothetical protein